MPLPVRTFNVVARSLAPSLARLDLDELEATARRREGLDDFGPTTFESGLHVLLDALEAEANLSALGRFMARGLILQLLATRLRLEALIARHPEIAEERIEAPIFILGLPRTGTTHLHNLVSQHPRLRSLPYWESLEPIPAALDEDPARAEAERRRRCELALRFQRYAMPLFDAMHEMTPDAAHEEIQLLAAEFSTVLFESMYLIPSYGRWYKQTDQRTAYRYLRRMLQALQWLRGPSRWVLKSPQHIEQLRTIHDVFPDAVVVQTHRDPVRVAASLCTMIAYGLRMQGAAVDPHAVGGYWLDRLEDFLRAGIADRDAVAGLRMLDVTFQDFMRDDVATADRVLEFAGLPASAASRDAITRYMAANPRGRHGTIEYRLDNFGLDAQQIRERLRFYQQHFDLQTE